ncbi:hypothetical protein, partial [Raoultella ornithinolytica]|uniref:hypothetical protein n=1 Tax=Raoultella ornithinolytica TaxID=54291 RepID=UPI0019808024
LQIHIKFIASWSAKSCGSPGRITFREQRDVGCVKLVMLPDAPSSPDSHQIYRFMVCEIIASTREDNVA